VAVWRLACTFWAEPEGVGAGEGAPSGATVSLGSTRLAAKLVAFDPPQIDPDMVHQRSGQPASNNSTSSLLRKRCMVCWRPMSAKSRQARRWLIRGRVQGVGFRYFAQREAEALGLSGYVRNLDDGRVEVYAAGPAHRLDELAGRLHHGPRWADVRGVDESEAAIEDGGSFEIEP